MEKYGFQLQLPDESPTKDLNSWSDDGLPLSDIDDSVGAFPLGVGEKNSDKHTAGFSAAAQPLSHSQSHSQSTVFLTSSLELDEGERRVAYEQTGDNFHSTVIGGCPYTIGSKNSHYRELNIENNSKANNMGSSGNFETPSSKNSNSSFSSSSSSSSSSSILQTCSSHSATITQVTHSGSKRYCESSTSTSSGDSGCSSFSTSSMQRLFFPQKFPQDLPGKRVRSGLQQESLRFGYNAGHDDVTDFLC